MTDKYSVGCSFQFWEWYLDHSNTYVFFWLRMKDTERIHKVFDFIMRNYKHEMYLKEIPSMLNMSNVSFSRYFKHHTRKTFSEYVTEVRISHACSLLMQDNQSISQISYSSGFENLSNFYRHFRKITGVIPKDYRKRFLKSPYSSGVE